MLNLDARQEFAYREAMKPTGQKAKIRTLHFTANEDQPLARLLLVGDP